MTKTIPVLNLAATQDELIEELREMLGGEAANSVWNLLLDHSELVIEDWWNDQPGMNAETRRD